MKSWYLAVTAILPVMVATNAYAEDDPCRAMVLHSVHAEEDPSDVMRPGEVFTAVTQFVRDAHSGETRLCQHGGYCYPTHVIVAGRSVEALRLTNCKVASRPMDSDADEITYSVLPGPGSTAACSRPPRSCS